MTRLELLVLLYSLESLLQRELSDEALAVIQKVIKEAEKEDKK